MDNSSYYDCPWLNCRLHFDTYSAAVEHLDRHLETFLPEKRKDLAHWRTLEVNLSLSDDSLLDTTGVIKEPPLSNVSKTLSASSLLKNSSQGSDTGNASTDPPDVLLQPATQSPPRLRVRVISPSSPAEVPESAGPSPTKSKLSPMPRSPYSLTDPSGQSGPVKRSTFASINDSSDASPAPVQDLPSPSPGTLFKGLMHLNTASPLASPSGNRPKFPATLGSPFSPVKPSRFSRSLYPQYTPGASSSSPTPFPSLSPSSSPSRILGDAPAQGEDTEASSLETSHRDVSKPKKQTQPQTPNSRVGGTQSLQPIDEIQPLMPLAVLAPPNPTVAQSSPSRKETNPPNLSKSPRRPRPVYASSRHRLTSPRPPFPLASDTTPGPSLPKQTPKMVSVTVSSANNDTAIHVPPAPSTPKPPTKSKSSHPRTISPRYPKPPSTSPSWSLFHARSRMPPTPSIDIPAPSVEHQRQADRLDAIDARVHASRPSGSAETMTDAMLMDVREVEAELGISSTDITKRMGVTADVYRAHHEALMFGSDAGNDLGPLSRDHLGNGGLVLPGEVGGENGVVSPSRSNISGVDADAANAKRNMSQVMEDAESLPWDGISSQAPVIDESW